MKDNYLMLNGQQITFTPEQIAKITAIMGDGKKKLGELEAGDTFKIGAHEFFVLEQLCGNGTSVLYKGLLEENMRFGKNNNYSDEGCVVRKRLEDFAKELEGIVGAGNLITHTVDLTSDDGLDDYGMINTKVSLLTCDLYRNYVKVIDKHKIDKWWWLVTPYSTPTHEDAEWMKCVSPRGNISNDNCNINYGVRPFCILNSNIFVSV